VSFGGSGGTSSTDEATFTPTSSTGTPVMGAVDETTPDAAAEGTLAIVRSTLNRALHVNLRDASGNEVAVGGGTQYTEGDTDATLTGTVALMEGAANAAVPLQGTAADGLLVNLGANNDVTVTGTVTANLAAGTNNIGDVDVLSLPALAAGTNNIGDVDVLTVPADPFGANADAASATGSISAKLRFIASTGIPVTGTVTVGSHAVTNAGTFAVQVDGAALTALQVIDNPVLVDDAAFTPATSSVMMAGFEADETATDSVDEGDAGAARMTLDRKQIVTPQPHTKGGLSIFRSLDLDESEEEVKATAGQVYGVWFTNTATSTRWLKFYNATAANVTVGTTTPVITLALPGNTSDDISGVFSSTHGIAFSTAISVAATTGVADADTGAPAANDVIVNIFYA